MVLHIGAKASRTFARTTICTFYHHIYIYKTIVVRKLLVLAVDVKAFSVEQKSTDTK